MIPPEVNASPLLAAQGICKSFPGVQALRDVDMRLERGEVLCIVGENGAGKSTLMKILGGVYKPDAGRIELDGEPVEIPSVPAAQRLGIVLIHQELNLAESLDVAGNLFLGRETVWGGPLRLLDRRMYAEAEQITGRLGLNVSPRRAVSTLSVGQQQLVEIGRALNMQSRVIIMDEPTSSLTQQETETLFRVIADLKRSGVSVLYISHRLREVQEIADRVVVLRDGRNAGELSRAEVSHAALVRMMVGRELKQFFRRTHEAPKTGKGAGSLPLLEVCDVRTAERPEHAISFSLQPGEVVGMGGLMGAGRTELAEALFGLRPISSGSVKIAGSTLAPNNPRAAIAAGLLLIPEDRRLHGLLLEDTVKRNISLPSLRRLSRGGLINRRAETKLAGEIRQRLGVKTPTLDQLVGLLSGGNQQKVVLGKWLARNPRVLILDEPTRGIDVGAKAEIYSLMDDLARGGTAILMISSDLEELLGVSDRLLVMHDGALAGRLSKAEMNEEAVMHLATGGHLRS